MDHDDQSKSNKSSSYIKLAGVEEGEYDALADLFLGESELAPKPFSPSPAEEQTEFPRPNSMSIRASIPVATGNPRNQQSSSGETQKTPHNKNPITDHSSMDPMNLIGEVQARIDATMNQAGPSTEMNIHEVPLIEAVLLGHLPVRASLWVRQYACSTARRRGEVIALIRAAAGSTSVDLISGTDGIQSHDCSSLQEALALVSRTADRVILRVDETTEPDLLDREEIDEITILTGADEAAVVSSYRLIKTLTTVWGTDENNGAPHIRLAVMGATSQQVADASAKLNRAVDAFLDRPIEIIDAAGRIDATGTTNIFRDSVTHSPTGILDQLVEINAPVPFDPSRVLTEGVHAIQSEIASADHEVVTAQSLIDHRQSPALDPQPQLQLQQQHEHQTVIEPKYEARSLQFHPEPKLNTVRAAHGRVDLVELIGGLEIIDLRCPFARDIQICVDDQGALHLVTDDSQEGPMARLETVRSWVRDHLPLILKAEPKVAMPDSNRRDAEIEMHLVTVKPQLVRGLIDSPVRLYALAQVQLRGESACALTPLN